MKSIYPKIIFILSFILPASFVGAGKTLMVNVTNLAHEEPGVVSRVDTQIKPWHMAYTYDHGHDFSQIDLQIPIQNGKQGAAYELYLDIDIRFKNWHKPRCITLKNFSLSIMKASLGQAMQNETFTVRRENMLSQKCGSKSTFQVDIDDLEKAGWGEKITLLVGCLGSFNDNVVCGDEYNDYGPVEKYLTLGFLSIDARNLTKLNVDFLGFKLLSGPCLSGLTGVFLPKFGVTSPETEKLEFCYYPKFTGYDAYFAQAQHSMRDLIDLCPYVRVNPKLSEAQVNAHSKVLVSVKDINIMIFRMLSRKDLLCLRRASRSYYQVLTTHLHTRVRSELESFGV